MPEKKKKPEVPEEDRRCATCYYYDEEDDCRKCFLHKATMNRGCAYPSRQFCCADWRDNRE